MRFRRTGRDRKPELNLASMIDATFLLLAFFIFTTGAGLNESKLSPNLRVQRGTDAKDDLEPQVVEVLRDGPATIFRLGSADHPTRESLALALEVLPKERGLFVRVYAGVDVAAAAAAIQTARNAGFEAVTYVPAK
ncbi:MAG: biopolymer transporter ExbD [Limnohabitans sp.]|jgi:biopolymer transport protein ExbD|nr:biopolymer transporter ExbD [Limnohabitans sp.]